jgi:hypothetical protein
MALVGVSDLAQAHGGIPRAFEITEEPGNPRDVVLRSDVWGLFRTMDGGQTWSWTCAEAYGASSTSVNHSNVAIARGGRVLLANAFKGLRITDDFCDWRTSPEFGGELVEDVVSSAAGPFVLTATYKGTSGAGGGIDGRVWQSTDNGDHFARVGTPLPETFAGSSLRFSPSDPRRVYVSGRTLEASGGILQRSNDGGTSWNASTFAVTNDNMVLRIVGVHPTRPDVVFVWGDLPEALAQDAPDEIWGTADGGLTWSLVYQGSGDLPGFAFSPDGTQIAIAGPVDGLRTANVDAALSVAPSAFAQTFAGKVWGLHWSSGGFTAGNDNFTAEGLPAFTYGKSSDEGHSFAPLMSLCDIKYGACGSSSTVATACNAVYDDPVGGFLQDFIQGPRCTSPVVTGTAGSKGSSGPDSASGGSAGSDPSSHSSTGGAGGTADRSGAPAPPDQLHINQGCAIERAASTGIRADALPSLFLLSVLCGLGRRGRARLRPRPEQVDRTTN